MKNVFYIKIIKSKFYKYCIPIGIFHFKIKDVMIINSCLSEIPIMLLVKVNTICQFFISFSKWICWVIYDKK